MPSAAKHSFEGRDAVDVVLGDQAVAALDDRDLRAQPLEGLPHLDPDGSAPDDGEAGGQLSQVEQALVGVVADLGQALDLCPGRP